MHVCLVPICVEFVVKKVREDCVQEVQRNLVLGRKELIKTFALLYSYALFDWCSVERWWSLQVPEVVRGANVFAHKKRM